MKLIAAHLSFRLALIALIGLLGIWLYRDQQVMAAAGWYVTPTGAGTRNGQSWANAFPKIQMALDVAQAGDTIYLGDGDYFEFLFTRTHGTAEAPITIVGSPNAILRGVAGINRTFSINHDYYLLDGWTINGHDGLGGAKANYRDILLYIHGDAAAYGGEVQRGPRGVEVRNMTFTNAGGECVRLRYFVRDADIHHNTITNCGIYDFVFNSGTKNGEGIYIGTSALQWGDGKNPTADPDHTDHNHIHHNIINTQGNECIEVKEGSSANLIEFNECTGNKDAESAGMASRSDGNVFRFNTIYENIGAGIRFGGHTVDGYTYGLHNDAYGNIIYDNGSGGIRFETSPQSVICGNNFVSPQGQVQPSIVAGPYGNEYLTKVAPPCGTLATWTPTPTNTPTNTPTHTPTPTATHTPTHTPTNTPTHTPTHTATNTPPQTSSPTATNTPIHTPTQISSPEPSQTPTSSPTEIPRNDTVVYLSFTREVLLTEHNLLVKDEDIVTYNLADRSWHLYFDGSDVGLANADVDAFAILPNGHLLLSFLSEIFIEGLGVVADSDIVEFIPTQLGSDTFGHFAFLLKGSMVGLTEPGEDVDAIALLADGALVISTQSRFEVPGVVGNGQQLFRFAPIYWGPETKGRWSIFPSNGDVGNLWLDESSLLSLAHAAEHVQAAGVATNQHDLTVCRLATLHLCQKGVFWADGSIDFGEAQIDAFGVSRGLVNSAMVTRGNTMIDDGGNVDDGDETTVPATNRQLYLPIVSNR